MNVDPLQSWITDFDCYPCFHNKDLLTFDIGYYKIVCSKISVEDIQRKGNSEKECADETLKAANISEEYRKGYATDRASVQPKWISVEDELPEEDGEYYTITELLYDTPAAPKGTVSIDVTEIWRDGQWWQDNEVWRVLYWAKPITLDIPEELANRPRFGCI